MPWPLWASPLRPPAESKDSKLVKMTHNYLRAVWQVN
jgi:hypothetical protein